MDPATMRQRVEEARVGRLATVGPGAQPHLVPCCFVLSGDVLYSAVDAKPKVSRRLQRIRNLMANPSAALLIDHYQDDWSQLWWVRVDGSARVLSSGDEGARALHLLAEKYAQYVREPRIGPVIAIDVTAWRAWP